MRTDGLITYHVTPESQPELWRFIRDAAEATGSPVPETVELYPVPDIELHGGRLLLGLPYVHGLPAAELADLIGNELSRLRGGHLTAGTRLAVAVAVSAPDRRASAMLGAVELAAGFERFILRHVGPLAAAGYYPADLWEGWRWTLRAGGVHPADPAPLRALGIEVEAGFARLLAQEFGAGCPRPVTFDEVPPEVWDAALLGQARAVRAAAAHVLGTPDALPEDVLRLVVAGHAGSLLRLAGAVSPDLDPVTRVLAPLLHRSLTRRLYRFEHPLSQSVYVGPAHDRIDTAALLATLDQPHVQARLSYLLV